MGRLEDDEGMGGWVGRDASHMGRRRRMDGEDGVDGMSR